MPRRIAKQLCLTFYWRSEEKHVAYFFALTRDFLPNSEDNLTKDDPKTFRRRTQDSDLLVMRLRNTAESEYGWQFIGTCLWEMRILKRLRRSLLLNRSLSNLFLSKFQIRRLPLNGGGRSSMSRAESPNTSEHLTASRSSSCLI